MSDDAFGDLLSGFSTPARQEGTAAKPEMDKDILDLFGPTPTVASASRASAGNGGHPPPAQQVNSVPYLSTSTVTLHEARWIRYLDN